MQIPLHTVHFSSVLIRSIIIHSSCSDFSQKRKMKVMSIIRRWIPCNLFFKRTCVTLCTVGTFAKNPSESKASPTLSWIWILGHYLYVHICRCHSTFHVAKSPTGLHGNHAFNIVEANWLKRRVTRGPEACAGWWGVSV